MRHKTLTQDDYLAILKLQNRIAILKSQAVEADANHRIAEGDYRNLVMSFYVKYGLTGEDHIDFNTGEIRYKKPDASTQISEPDASTQINETDKISENTSAGSSKPVIDSSDEVSSERKNPSKNDNKTKRSKRVPS